MTERMGLKWLDVLIRHEYGRRKQLLCAAQRRRSNMFHFSVHLLSALILLAKGCWRFGCGSIGFCQ